MTRLAAALVLLASVAFAAPMVVDRIVAVVGGEVILYSELQTQVDVTMSLRGMDPTNEVMRSRIEREVLDRMIDDKLILLIAKDDTTLVVSPEEVTREVDAEVARIKAEFQSEEEFASALAADGLTEAELRLRYRRQITNALYTRKLVRSRFSDVHVSRGEVERFFEANRDSIAVEPPSVRLRHLLIEPLVGPETETRLFSLADSLVTRARTGEDFSELAALYSDDGTAADGGDLGWFGRGEMVPEFEEAAFALGPGEISDVVRTQFGFHVIKTDEHLGERVKARHILISFVPSQADSARSLLLADSIAALPDLAARFDTLVTVFSRDVASIQQSGEVGWVPLEDLEIQFGNSFAYADSNSVVGPLSSPAGQHIFLVEGRREGHVLDTNDPDDFSLLKQLALRDKQQRRLSTWLAEQRHRLYVDDRLDR
jgi:parvulin-like peptidyl-prolyl isomerase